MKNISSLDLLNGIDCYSWNTNFNEEQEKYLEELLSKHLQKQGKVLNGRTSYKCPDCNQFLYYHHENNETVSLECRECKHLLLIRKG